MTEPRDEQRVSDRQRDRTVDTLARHMVAGSLSPDELSARTDEADAARTPGELSHALRDLPTLPEPPFLTRLTARVPLRAHVTAFLVVNAVLVVVWAVTRDRDADRNDDGFGLLWPFWVMLPWGILLGAHALYALRRPAFRRRAREGSR